LPPFNHFLQQNNWQKIGFGIFWIKQIQKMLPWLKTDFCGKNWGFGFFSQNKHRNSQITRLPPFNRSTRLI
jgi:hypothetical protein